MSFTEFISDMALWWGDLSYSVWIYFALFLPLTAIVYQLTPAKSRKLVLLGASWIFFASLSKWLLLVNIAESVFVWRMGLLIEKINKDKNIKRKERAAKRRKSLVWGIVFLLLVLVGFKYLDFMGLNLVRLSQLLRHPVNWKLLNIAAPLGISYYTLMAISYLTDISREDIEADKSLVNVALYLSFFPKIVEGPITRYSEDSKALFAGNPIKYQDLAEGYQRIAWGLFKKIVIADQLSPSISALYEGTYTDGGVALYAAFAFTIQEYTDFSGSIDIVIGSARIFGVRMAENFTQPFFAKNASDFWHRWHITLGTFFRDYIFYPVSLAKPVMKFTKKVKSVLGQGVAHFTAPTIALFLVWLSNGIWHGPRWTYIFYGMYYFVLIFIENILEEPFLALLKKMHLKEESLPVRIFRFIKLFFIIIIGEMFFRAQTLDIGISMFKSIFTDLRFDMLIANMGNLNMDFYAYLSVYGGLIVVIAVSIMKEIHFPMRSRLESLPLPLRFAFWYVCIFVIILFGAYGTGYSSEDLIYAQF